MPQETKLELHPLDILFTKPFITNYFDEGPSSVEDTSKIKGATSYAEALQLEENAESNMSLENALQRLLQGTLQVEDFPSIRVVHHDGRYYSLDNKRLHLFKQFASARGSHCSHASSSEAELSISEDSTNHRTRSNLPSVPVLLLPANKEFVSTLANLSTGGQHVLLLKSVAGHGLNWMQQTSFEDLVLPWGSKACLNPDMYKSMVKKLPENFQSGLGHYGSLLMPLVAEELRSQVGQALECCSDQPCAAVHLHLLPEARQVTPLSNISSDSRLVTIMPVGSDLSADSGEDDEKCVGLAELKIRPTDLCLLSSEPLLNPPLDLQQRKDLALILIKSPSTDEDGSMGFKAWISGSNHNSPLLHALNDTDSGESQAAGNDRVKGGRCYLTPLCNTATGQRVWKALSSLSQTKNAVPFQHILDPNFSNGNQGFVEFPGYSISPDLHPHPVGSLRAAALKYCKDCLLNSSQTTAVVNIAVATSAPSTSSQKSRVVHLIQGPPGTGKTSTIVRMLLVLAGSGSSTLVCAPTNVAVQEVAQRLLHELPRAQFGAPGCQGHNLKGSCSLVVGDILMQASEDHNDAEGPISSILLPLRAKRLKEALGPQGLGHKCGTLSRLLTSSLVDRYKLHLCNSTALDSARSCIMEKGGAVPDKDGFKAWMLSQLTSQIECITSMGLTLLHDVPGEMMIPSTAVNVHRILDCCKKLLDCVKILPPKVLMDASMSPLVSPDSSVTLTPEQEGCISGPDTIAAVSSVSTLLAASTCLFRALLAPVSSWIPPRLIQSDFGMEKMCLECAKIVFCTVSSSGRSIMKERTGFDACIIDEACQLVESETSIIFQGWPDLRALVLVGDPKQLPATVMSPLAASMGYDRSLFERLQQLGSPMLMLDVQYRMHPQISHFPRMQFYNGKVDDGDNVKDPGYKMSVGIPVGDVSDETAGCLGPFAFLDVPQSWEERPDSSSTSFINPIEASMACALVKALKLHRQGAISSSKASDSLAKLSIGIISPYSAQVDLIISKLGMRRSTKLGVGRPAFASEEEEGCQVEVRSVDGFQGREMDVIIFSTVRSNNKDAIGFLKDPRRLNVAITRGKFAVWILGHGECLSRSNKVWSALIESAMQRCCFISASTIPALDREVKKCNLVVKRLQILQQPGNQLFNDKLWEVIDTILQLADGHRPSRYPDCLVTPWSQDGDFKYLIHGQRVQGMFLIWSVDVDRLSCRQYLKIWDICKQGKQMSWAKRLSAAYIVYSSEYLKRCLTVYKDASTGKHLPKEWNCDSAFVWRRQNGAGAGVEEISCGTPSSSSLLGTTLESSSVQDSLILMKFFPLSSAVATALCWSKQGSSLELLFKLNSEETRIVDYPKSAFIQGRSGTGKTTVIVKKMLQLEEASEAFVSSEEGSYSMGEAGSDDSRDLHRGSSTNDQPAHVQQGGKLRQLLVTLSPKLCAALRSSISKIKATQAGLASQSSNHLAESVEGLGNDLLLLDEEEEAKLLGNLPDRLTEVGDELCPLVLTFQKLLFMLNASLKSPFVFGSKTSARKAAREHQRGCHIHAVRKDSTRPRRQIEYVGDYDDDDEVVDEEEKEEEEEEETGESEDEGRIQANDRGDVGIQGRLVSAEVEVDFDRFEGLYWSNLDADLRRGNDPSVVWTEIQSTIKGGLDALKTEGGKIGQQAYLEMSMTRAGAHLSESRREGIYSLFKQYETLKGQRWHWDMADLTSHVYMELRRQNGLQPHQAFHRVYVDEVQDLTPSQLALFKYLCSMPAVGLLFAGDTAQTIARGTNFRFQVIRSLVYQEFFPKDRPEERADDASPGTIIQMAGSSRSGSKHSAAQPAVPPDMFQLVENYRTHQSIVQLAHSLVQALMHFFPYSIDKLNPESSHLSGKTPIFLEGGDPLMTMISANSGNESGDKSLGAAGCEFGAEQAVLVRDEAAKAEVIKKYGQRMLVLTVFECKGIEFQTVLVYNFLSSSKFGNKWRLMYKLLKHMHRLPEDKLALYSCPDFDPNLHNLLCSELKQLYVLITRAKDCVLIWESDWKVSEPMRDFWSFQQLVDIKPMSSEVLAIMHRVSSPKEWAKRANEFFNDKQYAMAEFCFVRAGDVSNAMRCQATALSFRAAKEGNASTAKELLIKAAGIYEELGLKDKQMFERAANCRVKGQDWLKAAHLFRDQTEPKRPRQAAECFEQGGAWEDATMTWVALGDRDSAIKACVCGREWDLGVSLLQSWSSTAACEDGDSVEIERLRSNLDAFAKKAALFQLRDKAGSRVQLSKYTDLMSTSVAEAFFQRHALHEEELQLYLTIPDYEKAGGKLEFLGRTEEAVEVYKQAGAIIKAAMLLMNCLQNEVLEKCKDETSVRGISFNQKAKQYLADLSWYLFQITDASSSKLALAGMLREVETLQWLESEGSTVCFPSKELQPHAHKDSGWQLALEMLNNHMKRQREHQGSWLGLALAAHNLTYVLSLNDALRKASFDMEMSACKEPAVFSTANQSLKLSLLAALVHGSELFVELSGQIRQQYSQLLPILQAVCDQGLKPFDSRHLALLNAAMNLLGARSKPGAPTIVQLGWWSTPALSARLGTHSKNKKMSQTGLRQSCEVSLVDFCREARRHWSQCILLVDQGLVTEATKTLVYLLPSAPKFLQSLNNSKSQGLQLCSSSDISETAVIQWNVPNAPSKLQRCLPHAVTLLIAGFQACVRKEVVPSLCDLRQVQPDRQKTAEMFQEQLLLAVVCAVLPQAYHSERYQHIYDAEPSSNDLSQDAGSDMLKRGCLPGLCQAFQCSQEEAVQSFLAMMARGVVENRTQNPVSKQKVAQPMYHEFLGYNSIGRLCILQGHLQVPLNGDLLWSFKSHDDNVWGIPQDTPYNSMAPWQHLLLSGMYMARVMVEVGSENAKAYDEMREIHAQAFRSVVSGLEGACSTYSDITDWKAAGRKSYIRPDTFLYLLERYCLLAMSCTTLLRGMIVPASMAMVHLCAQGPTSVWTALCSREASLSMRDCLEQSLVAASRVLAEILSPQTALPEWMEMYSMDKALQESLTIRAVVLLTTICVNESPSSVSVKQITAKMILDATVGSPFLNHLPNSFKVWISRSALRQDLNFDKGSIISGLKRSLHQIGDGLVCLVRDNTDLDEIVKGIKTFCVETSYPIPEASICPAGCIPSSSNQVVTFSVHELITYVTGIPSAKAFCPPSNHVDADTDLDMDMQHEDGLEKENSGLEDAISTLTSGSAKENSGLEDANSTFTSGSTTYHEDPVRMFFNTHPWTRGALLRWRLRAGTAFSGRMSQLSRLQREAGINLMTLAVTSEADAPQDAPPGLKVVATCVEGVETAIRVAWPSSFQSKKIEVFEYISCFIDLLCPLQVEATALLNSIHTLQIHLSDEEDDKNDEDCEVLQQYQSQLNDLLALCDPRCSMHVSWRKAQLQEDIVSPLKLLTNKIKARFGKRLSVLQDPSGTAGISQLSDDQEEGLSTKTVDQNSASTALKKKGKKKKTHNKKRKGH
ncbi:hypothetical protein CEUSTIGMA_g12224.t1 [Chlamydomonas eustigma]|uniref:UvrD-like helicase ATP-binding domain-containing protein n=1 Tax=Chlamydomonas eustigma TaxID=1157962 RepID=A0A250XP74_9CHLO|nr:hypothetical protein CEUSTIGMA_g12224.t1 [Chlamydomonas eustigma]|eukprot:GAX84803.1 hypothetical protein CEUSTIGMA_g12224.t1 [Chlamydomonas eustigma]